MDEYKALTVVNLPFTGKRFNPGDMISHAEFEAEADAAAASVDVNTEGDNLLTADEQVDYFKEWGTISDDPEAELHPDHLPVDPNKPTLAQQIELAKTAVADLEAAGKDVPDELRAFAEMDYQHVTSSENGTGGDSHE